MMKRFYNLILIFFAFMLLCACSRTSQLKSAQSAFEKGDWETAIERANKLLEKNQNDEEAKSAEQLIEESQRQIKEEKAEMLLVEATAYSKQEDWRRAQERIETLQKDYSDTAAANEAERIADAVQKGLDEENAASMFDEAKEQYEKEDWQAAVDQLTLMLHKYPDTIKRTEAETIVAACQEKIDYQRAVEYLERAQKNLENEEYSSAVSACQQVHKLAPDTELIAQADTIAISAYTAWVQYLYELKSASMVDYVTDEFEKYYPDAEALTDCRELALKAAEARKQEEQEQLQKEKEEARNIIQVTKVSVSEPDSAGGVELYFNFVNKSEKTIKYVNFAVTFYNAVGDVVNGKYNYGSVNYCQATGPFATGEGITGTWWHWGDFYNWNIKTVKLVNLSIEYMDGSTVSLTPEQIEYVQN